jgi:hypothetical protein
MKRFQNVKGKFQQEREAQALGNSHSSMDSDGERE